MHGFSMAAHCDLGRTPGETRSSPWRRALAEAGKQHSARITAVDSDHAGYVAPYLDFFEFSMCG
jgi:hypothetical protein